MELTGFLPLVRRWWPVLLLSMVVAGAIAYVFASRLEPTYEARAALVTGPINADFGTLRASGELARTYSELATSGPILAPAARQAGVRAPLPDLRKVVSASANQVTRIVSIRVQDDDPERAARFANAVAARLIALSTRTPTVDLERVDEFMRQREVEALSEAARDGIREAVTRVYGQPVAGRLQVVDEAIPPDEPIAPAVSLLTMLAALAGLVGAAMFILFREYSRGAIRDEQELVAIADVPVLGSVAVARGAERDGLVVVDVPASARAAEYRLIAAKIGVFEEGSSLRSLLVVAADEKSGTGALAANLAAAFAEGNARVTLVDANTVEGEITGLLDLDERPGYGDLVRRSNGAAETPNLDGVRVRHVDGLDVLPRGRNGGPDVVEPDRARALLAELLGDSDVVVVNAPAVERSPSTLVWAHVADATVLVVRVNSKRETVSEAVKSLSVVGANLIGTVFREGRTLSLRRP